MERREFLKQSAVTVAAAASPKFSAAATPITSIARGVRRRVIAEALRYLL